MVSLRSLPLSAAVVCALAFAACGSSSTTTVVEQQAPPQTQTTTTVTTTSTAGEEDGGGGDTTVSEDGAPPLSGPTPETECRLGVYAGSANTSCGFAQAVADQYYATGSPSFEATSPATDVTYQVSCEVGASLITCTAGNNARVYLTQ